MLFWDVQAELNFMKLSSNVQTYLLLIEDCKVLSLSFNSFDFIVHPLAKFGMSHSDAICLEEIPEYITDAMPLM